MAVCSGIILNDSGKVIYMLIAEYKQVLGLSRKGNIEVVGNLPNNVIALPLIGAYMI